MDFSRSWVKSWIKIQDPIRDQTRDQTRDPRPDFNRSDFDSEFQNLHKPVVNKNDYELSTVRSTLLRTDEEGSFNTSKCHEESVTVEESIARTELESPN